MTDEDREFAARQALRGCQIVVSPQQQTCRLYSCVTEAAFPSCIRWVSQSCEICGLETPACQTLLGKNFMVSCGAEVEALTMAQETAALGDYCATMPKLPNP